MNCRDGTDVAPLAVAVCRGNIPLVKTLLARNDVARDPDDNKGNTPLLLAAWLGNLPLLGIFLNIPWINIWHRNHKRETALALAAQEGHVDVVKRFLNPRLGATAYVLEDAVTAVNSGGRSAGILMEIFGFAGETLHSKRHQVVKRRLWN